MGTLGTISMMVGVLAAVIAVISGAAGGIKRSRMLARVTDYATYFTAFMLSVSVGVLQLALITTDYSLQYVVDYTSSSLSIFYRVGSMWAGQGGSLLLWGWMVSLCAAYIAYTNRVKSWGMSAYTFSVFAFISGLFAALSVFLASPFTASTEQFIDGMGLNPLLQDPLQIIHPLALYAGYVLYTVPFAILVGALLAGDRFGPWIRVAQVWNVLSWVMLTLGIVLGARWAYAELGWGGYWGWDPVENASLLPWLTGTIVMHWGLTHRGSKRLRLTSVIMVMLTFILCLFGTFLTRSGVVSSVHAFGESNLGTFLGAAIGFIVLGCGALIVWRLPMLRYTNPQAKSRGWAGQLVLLVLLTAITIAVLWGTLYPMFTRALQGQEIAVTPGFFRVVITPLGVAILGLFAASPFLPGQKVPDQKREWFIRGGVFAAVLGGVLLVTHGGNPGVGLVLALSVLAVMTVFRKAKPRILEAYADDQPRSVGVIRAAGPYIGHVGLVVMLAAVTLNTAFQVQGDVTLKLGETSVVNSQSVRLSNVAVNSFEDKDSFAAEVEFLNASGEPVSSVTSRLEQFSNQEQLHAEVGIISSLSGDTYVVVKTADATPGAETATLTVFNNPAVMWIWVGGALLVLGGLLFMIPRRRRKDDIGHAVEPADMELASLLDAALSAARAIRDGDTMPENTPDPVADLLKKASELTKSPSGEEATPDDVVAFLEEARARVGVPATGIVEAERVRLVEPEKAVKPERAVTVAPPADGSAKPRRTGLLVVGGLVLLVLIVGGAYLFGHSSGQAVPGISGTPSSSTPSSPPSAQPADPAQISALMEKIKANPKDSVSMLALGDIYFNAQDYKNAKVFYEKASVLTPNDDAVWVALGAAAFNLGDSVTAEPAWLKAVKINPKNAEAYYDLGFLYLSASPSDTVKAKEMWQKVIDIDPNADIAKTVKTHLESLSSPAPSASASTGTGSSQAPASDPATDVPAASSAPASPNAP